MTEEEYNAALKELEEKWNEDDTELLVKLSDKIYEYEKEHYPIGMPSPIDALEFRIDQHGLTPNDLMEYIGDIETVKRILNREEMLTEEMIAKLSTALDIPIDILTERE